MSDAVEASIISQPLTMATAGGHMDPPVTAAPDAPPAPPMEEAIGHLNGLRHYMEYHRGLRHLTPILNQLQISIEEHNTGSQTVPWSIVSWLQHAQIAGSTFKSR